MTVPDAREQSFPRPFKRVSGGSDHARSKLPATRLSPELEPRHRSRRCCEIAVGRGAFRHRPGGFPATALSVTVRENASRSHLGGSSHTGRAKPHIQDDRENNTSYKSRHVKCKPIGFFLDFLVNSAVWVSTELETEFWPHRFKTTLNDPTNCAPEGS